jgi:outer membrane protein assembly factor BamB
VYGCLNDLTFTYQKTYNTLVSPIFITLIANRMYVGSSANSIFIYNQSTTSTPLTISTHSNLCPLSTQSIYSVAVDAFNNLIYPCYSNRTVHLDYRNGTVNKLRTVGSPGFAFFDSKGRFIIETDFPTGLFFYY